MPNLQVVTRARRQRYGRGVTEPRRVLIDWDYGAHGIWWVLTKEEKEEPAPPGQWSEARPSERSHAARPWSGRLTSELLDDLQAWNDDWYHQDLDIRLLARPRVEAA